MQHFKKCELGFIVWESHLSCFMCSGEEEARREYIASQLPRDADSHRLLSKQCI